MDERDGLQERERERERKRERERERKRERERESMIYVLSAWFDDDDDE